MGNTDAKTLAHLDADDVRLYLLLGRSILRYADEREEWERQMVVQLGREIRQYLPVIHAAVSRISNNETLDGLALPEEILREGPSFRDGGS